MCRSSRLYLLRHGQVRDFEKIPIYGRTDVELTRVGVLQMEYAAERLRFSEIQAIYSSDLKRSVRSAEIIARSHSLQIFNCPELGEMHFGQWEGMTLAELRKHYPEELEERRADVVHFRPPGHGENVAEVSQRVLPFLAEILRAQEGRDFALVGHGVVNRIILADALNLDLRNLFNIQQDYGCLNIVDYKSEGRTVRLLNG